MNTDNLLDSLNKRFDHAALKSETTESDIILLCQQAIEFDLFAVAINPVWVPVAKKELTGSDVSIVSVAGFPLGANRTDIKVAEAVKAASDGAHEIDMVANIGWLLAGHLKKVEEEISALRKNLSYNVLLKVIVETGKLTPALQRQSVDAVIAGGAQFIKTSTGFFGGAEVEDVATLAEAAGGRIEVKASGGIRSLSQCRAMLKAGATRLGSSASVEIMREYADQSHR